MLRRSHDTASRIIHTWYIVHWPSDTKIYVMYVIRSRGDSLGKWWWHLVGLVGISSLVFACACNPALCCAWNARETSGETKMFKQVPQVRQQVPLIFTNCLNLLSRHGRKLHNLYSHCPWPGFCETEWQIWPKMTPADDRQKQKVVARQLERVEKRGAKAERDFKR